MDERGAATAQRMLSRRLARALRRACLLSAPWSAGCRGTIGVPVITEVTGDESEYVNSGDVIPALVGVVRALISP
jgi:hypothetical protein